MEQVRRKNFIGNNIRWKNFSGRKSQYPDSRSFVIDLKPDEVEFLIANGWPVEFWDSIKPDEPQIPVLRIQIKYNEWPPTIVGADSEKKHKYDKDSVGDLDGVWITDAKIRATLGKTGKVYLNELWVTIMDNPLSADYANLPWG